MNNLLYKLFKFANRLDAGGLHKLADEIDEILKIAAEKDYYGYSKKDIEKQPVWELPLSPDQHKKYYGVEPGYKLNEPSQQQEQKDEPVSGKKSLVDVLGFLRRLGRNNGARLVGSGSVPYAHHIMVPLEIEDPEKFFKFAKSLFNTQVAGSPATDFAHIITDGIITVDYGNNVSDLYSPNHIIVTFIPYKKLSQQDLESLVDVIDQLFANRL